MIDVDFGDEDEAVEIIQVTDSESLDDFLARNSFRVVYQTNNFFLPQVRHMIERGDAINLRPEYQRRLRWANHQKSKLIESLLLNIPIPPVFFYETDAARYEVMDGQQRMNAIREFFAGDFRLTGLSVLSPLNGLTYSKCPPRIRRTLDRASISAIVLLLESETEKIDSNQLSLKVIRRLVFDRLNTGGQKLNPQEIRNALHPGEINNATIELSRDIYFTSIFGIPSYEESNEDEFYENPNRQKNSLYRTMRDCELVLRYFALQDDMNIRGSMKSMLDRAIERQVSSDEIQIEKQIYRNILRFWYDISNRRPFTLDVENSSSKVSAALYDSSMVAVYRKVKDQGVENVDSILANLSEQADAILGRLNDALNDDEAYEIIVGRGNTAESVKNRIQMLERIVSG